MSDLRLGPGVLEILDLGSASALERELRDTESSGFGHVVIDLSELEFMDSTGIGVLLRAQQAAGENGHRVLPDADRITSNGYSN